MQPTRRSSARWIFRALILLATLLDIACSGGNGTTPYEGDEPDECSDGADNDRNKGAMPVARCS